LDVQGAELGVLQGASKILRTVKWVDIEVEFSPIYDGVPLFSEIDQFLRSQGFDLWRLGQLMHYSDSGLIERQPTLPMDIDVGFLTQRVEMAGGGQLVWGQAYYVRREYCFTADEYGAGSEGDRAAAVAFAAGFHDLAASAAPPDLAERLRPAAERSRFQDADTIVFTHIPKTGGEAVRVALEGAMGTPGRRGFDEWLFGDLSDWASIDEERLANVVGAHGPAVLDAGAKLISGHFSTTTTRSAYPGARHITLLREGRSRLLSLWTFWRGVSRTRLEGWGTWGAAVDASSSGSLRDLLLSSSVVQQVDNVVIRALLWQHPLVPNDRRIDPVHDEALLQEARLVLNSYDFVDVIENPSWSSNLQDWLGRPFNVDRSNATSRPLPHLTANLDEELTDEVLDDLQRLNRLDDRLWRHVARRTMPGANPGSISERAFASTVAKHSRLLSGQQVPGS
jgi:hypothetical protein